MSRLANSPAKQEDCEAIQTWVYMSNQLCDLVGVCRSNKPIMYQQRSGFCQTLHCPSFLVRDSSRLATLQADWDPRPTVKNPEINQTRSWCLSGTDPKPLAQSSAARPSSASAENRVERRVKAPVEVSTALTERRCHLGSGRHALRPHIRCQPTVQCATQRLTHPSLASPWPPSSVSNPPGTLFVYLLFF
jgi:hypothetical protein